MITDVSSQREKPMAQPKSLTWLGTVLASALFTTFISPQAGLWGRGLRTSLPLFILFLSVAILWKGKVVEQQLEMRALPIIAGLVFAGTSFLRHLSEPSPTVLHNQGISAIVCVALWISIIVLRTGFPKAVEPVRWISLLVLGVSLGMGIPLLLEKPGIARLTMGNPMADVYAAELYPKGVTNYSWYTPVAFAFPVLANWIYKSSVKRWLKIIGWGLLSAAAIATILSTFTMAMFLLIAGIVGWLALTALTATSRWVRGFVALILFVMLLSFPTLYFFGKMFEATQFSVQKATRIFTGAFEVGLLDADETGRTVMFVDTMETFFKYPLFGAWGLAEGDYYVGGHSSWADTLAWQGIFGMMLWLAFLSPSWRRGKNCWSVEDGVAGGTLSWILVGVGGILNPTLHSSIGLLLLWLYDEGAIWQTRKAAMMRRQF